VFANSVNNSPLVTFVSECPKFCDAINSFVAFIGLFTCRRVLHGSLAFLMIFMEGFNTPTHVVGITPPLTTLWRATFENFADMLGFASNQATFRSAATSCEEDCEDCEQDKCLTVHAVLLRVLMRSGGR